MKHTLFALLCAASVAGAAPSESKSSAPATAAPQSKQKVVTWAGVRWHPLADARKKALAPRTARPIVFLRMLGELKGKT